MADVATLPADAPAPPGGCEWKHVEALRIGDEIDAGRHDLLAGERQRFFFRITKLEPKPKTIYVTMVPAHPLLSGWDRRRFRRDEWVAVRS